MRKALILILFAAVTLMLTAADPAAAAPALIGPTPYLGFSNSPFKGVNFSQFYLEDFESGQLRTPGVTASVNTPGLSSGVLNPGGTTDSVDADDGVIDGYLDRLTGDCDETVKWAGRPSYINVSTLPPPVKYAWFEIDITGIYRDWKNGLYPNYGIQLRPFSNDHQFNQFHISDYMQRPDLRPKLVVNP